MSIYSVTIKKPVSKRMERVYIAQYITATDDNDLNKKIQTLLRTYFLSNDDTLDIQIREVK